MVYNINNESERQVFKQLSTTDQLFALYEIVSHNRTEQQSSLSRLANIEKKQIESDRVMKEFKKELRAVRETREARERKLAYLLDTAPNAKDMTPEEKNSLTDKLIAIGSAKKQDAQWLPVVKEALRIIVILLGIVLGKQLLP